MKPSKWEIQERNYSRKQFTGMGKNVAVVFRWRQVAKSFEPSFMYGLLNTFKYTKIIRSLQ
ncbi:MAG TPA: hypothetical protein DCQ29_02000 [Chitinophagaceae bacterium]|nr:hypothetical protein [Chitinophagaceae bacterium]